MLKNIIRKKKNMLKFIELITSENETVTKSVSMFINKSFEIRIIFLYVCYFIPRMISCFVHNLSYFMLCLYGAFYDVK